VCEHRLQAPGSRLQVAVAVQLVAWSLQLVA